MNDREILDRLWEAHRETPFASFSLQRKLDLRHNAVRTVLNLINDMADSGEVRSGYRIKRVASTVDKMAQAQQNDSDSLKGLPLIGQKNHLQGNPESDDSPYADASHLHRYPHFSVASNRESTTADTISNLSV